MRASGVAVLLAAAGVLVGCGTRCTMIGAESGVSVDLGPRDADSATSVQVCVDGRCARAERAGQHQLWAPVDSLGSGAVDVEVRDLGRTLLRRKETPQESRPNGPWCDPVVHQVSVTLPAV